MVWLLGNKKVRPKQQCDEEVFVSLFSDDEAVTFVEPSVFDTDDELLLSDTALSLDTTILGSDECSNFSSSSVTKQDQIEHSHVVLERF